MSKFKSVSMSLMLFISAVVFSDAFGQAAVYDSANFWKNAAIAISTADIATSTAESVKNELLNLKNYDGNITQWSDAQQLLEKLANTVSQGNAISYTAQNMNDEFKNKFPGYQPQQDYDKAYQGWSSTVMDTLRNILASAGMQANTFSDEQATLDELKRLSTSAQGRMQAVQVGNMIAANQVGQMQKLRQLVVSQTNAQNAYMAYKVQKEQSEEAAANNLLDHPLAYPKYGSGQGFGKGNMPQISH